MGAMLDVLRAHEAHAIKFNVVSYDTQVAGDGSGIHFLIDGYICETYYETLVVTGGEWAKLTEPDGELPETIMVRLTPVI